MFSETIRDLRNQFFLRQIRIPFKNTTDSRDGLFIGKHYCDEEEFFLESIPLCLYLFLNAELVRAVHNRAAMTDKVKSEKPPLQKTH